MPVPTTIANFFGLIRKSGLIDEETLAGIAIGLPREPAACADALVEAELLTPFQAKQLLTGRLRGLVLGAYRVLCPLGKGGMGVVYLAEHAALGRKVAVKVLTEEHSREKLALERFFREARAAAALDHPNIVRLHDVAEVDGTHFLVMEFVDGTDLQALVERTGPLHAAQAAGYVAQAAAGLQHAHDRGFIHRDVKPANLIVGKNGVVKVLDMGLARSVYNPKDALTGTLGEDVITGTADYLSPEQALNVQLDARADVYSLGATFYTLLTGRPPYEGGTGQKLAQHQMAAPPDVRAVRPEVPEQMAAVIVRMMAKQPAERYPTARAVRAALAPWVPEVNPGSAVTASLKAAATTTKLLKSPDRPVRARIVGALRSNRAGIAFACAAGLLAVGFVFALPAGPRPTADLPPGVEPKVPNPVPTPLVNRVRLLTGHTAHVNDVVFSPDETRLASVDWVGKLVIWDVGTGQRLHELPTRPGARCLACATTPDGRHLLVAGERMPILVFEWATGKEVREYPAHDRGTWGLAVSPSGGHLLSSGADGSAVLRTLPGGDEVRRFEFEAKIVWSVAFSADGTKIAAGSGRAPAPEESNLIKVWATVDGRELHRLAGHEWDVRTIAFRPDGGALVSGGFDGTVRLWDLTTGAAAHPVGTHDGVVERVYFLSGGRQLLTCGGPMQEEHRPSGEGTAVKLWDADTGRELKCWRGDEWTDLISLTPAPSGRLVAAGARDRSVRVWSLADTPTAPASRLVHAFELSQGAAFRSRYENRQHSDQAAQLLVGSGVFLHCWKKESVAEFRGEPGAGRPWVGVTNLNEELSSQIIFQFDDAVAVPLVAGKRYRVRLEYQTTSEAEGWAYVRNPKGGDFSSIAEARLERTEGKWRTVSMTFRRPADGKIDTCVVNSAVGEGNLLAVRAVEVFEIE